MGFREILAAGDQALRALTGDDVTFSPAVGSPVEVRGVFSERYVRTSTTPGEAGVSTTGPAVFLRLDDLPSDPSDTDAQVTIAGVTYSAHEVEPDGLGGVLLFLHKV